MKFQIGLTHNFLLFFTIFAW